MATNKTMIRRNGYRSKSGKELSNKRCKGRVKLANALKPKARKN
jgi:hypothetical protein